MTTGVRGRRGSRAITGSLALTVLAAVALVAPGVFEQMSTAAAQGLAALAVAVGELFSELLLQPFLEGLQPSISDAGTPAPAPEGGPP